MLLGREGPRREVDTHQPQGRTDTYRGGFIELIPDERVVEVDQFETEDPALRGQMTITIALVDEQDGTRVPGMHEGLPPGLSLADNEAGWKSRGIVAAPRIRAAGREVT
ncbi:MAG: SRPBCC domain-containing protein [Verrucomicrobiota bacterium]